MKDESITPEESLRVIQAMIDRTKDRLVENSFYLLLWGWLVFTAALLHFGLMTFTRISQPYMVWNLMWLGVVVSIVRGVRDQKKTIVKTYLSDTMQLFGICLGILFSGLAFVFGYFDLWMYSYPIYLLVYAVACFFMGSVMKFNFLKWAGLSCLFLVVASVFLAFKFQLLLMATAVLIGYIIPGHILNRGKQVK